MKYVLYFYIFRSKCAEPSIIFFLCFLNFVLSSYVVEIFSE